MRITKALIAFVIVLMVYLVGCTLPTSPVTQPDSPSSTSTPAPEQQIATSKRTQVEDERLDNQNELTFYDSSGNPIVYTEDSEHIYLFSGEPVAYIYSGSVYSFSGRHLGRFENGWIRDNEGKCVFFTEQAVGGPIKSMKKMIPIKSVKLMRPMKSMREMRPIKPIDTLLWSELSGEQFFEN